MKFGGTPTRFPGSQSASPPGADRPVFSSLVPGDIRPLGDGSESDAPKLAMAGYLDSFFGFADQALYRAVVQDPDCPLHRLVQQLSPDRQKLLEQWISRRDWERLGYALQQEDPVLAISGLLGMAQSFQRIGRDPAASQFNQWVVLLANQAMGPSSPHLEKMGEQAQQALALLHGKGGFGARVEFFGDRFLEETLDPWLLLGFGVGGAAYRLGKWGTAAWLGRLARPIGFSRWLGIQALSTGVGLSAESLAFVSILRGGHALMGTDGPARPWGRELLSTGLTLGLLRGAGQVTRSLGTRLAAGELGRFTLPTQLKISQALLPQAGSLGGLMMSHGLQQHWGWLPRQDGFTLLTDSLLTLAQFGMAGRLSHRLMGRSFHRWQESIEQNIQNLLPPLSGFPWTKLSFNPAHFSPALGRIPNEVKSSLPIFMSEKGGDGDKPGFGKILSFPGGKKINASAKRAEQEVRDIGQTFSELQREGLRLEKYLRWDFLEIVGKVEAHLRRVYQGRKVTPGFSKEIKKLYHSFIERSHDLLEFYPQVQNLHRAALAQKHSAQPWIKTLEDRLGDILKLGLIQGHWYEQLHQSLLLRQYLPTVEAMDHLKDAYNHIGLKDEGGEVGLYTWNHLLETRFRAQGMEGMVFGLGLKEVFREAGGTDGSKPSNKKYVLARESGRQKDFEHTFEILREINREREQSYDYLELLTETMVPEPGVRTSFLKFGGSYRAPFRNWLTVHLPALVLQHNGKFNTLKTQLLAMEPFLPPGHRQTNLVTAWWLVQAINGRGSPRDWMRQMPADLAEGSDIKQVLKQVFEMVGQRRVTNKKLQKAFGTSGDLAIFANALFSFLRHSENPYKAFRHAARSPKSIREDVLTLTGALLGAYHGRGYFTPHTLRDWRENKFGKNENDESAHPVASFYRQFGRVRKVLGNFNDRWEDPNWEPQAVSYYFNPNINSLKDGIRLSALSWRADRIYQRAEEEILEFSWELQGMLRRGVGTGAMQREADHFISRLKNSKEILLTHRASLNHIFNTGVAYLAEGKPNSMHSPLAFLAGRIKDISFVQKKQDSIFRHLHDLTQLKSSGSTSLHLVERLLKDLNEINHNFKGDPPLSLQAFQPEPIPAEASKRVYEGAAGVGPAQPPPQLKVTQWERRSDWGWTQVLIRDLSSLRDSGGTVEKLLERYLDLVGAQYPYQPENRSLARHLSMSSLLTVLTPAFLEIHRKNPSKGLRELEALNPTEDGQNREAWRAVTYLAMRLIQGAKFDGYLLADIAEAFRQTDLPNREMFLPQPTPMEERLKTLSDMLLGKTSITSEPLMEWSTSSRPVDQVATAIEIFSRYPSRPTDAIRYLTRFFSDRTPDREKVAIRVVGILAGASGMEIPKDALPLKVSQDSARNMIKINLDKKFQGRKEPVTTKGPESFSNLMSPQGYFFHIRKGILQWEKEVALLPTTEEWSNIRARIEASPLYLIDHLAIFFHENPLLAKAVMAYGDLLPSSSVLIQDKGLQRELGKRSEDVIAAKELEAMGKQIWYRYQKGARLYYPNQHDISRRPDPEFLEGIKELPPILVKVLVNLEVRPAMVLLLLNKMGLSSVDIPEGETLAE